VHNFKVKFENGCKMLAQASRAETDSFVSWLEYYELNFGDIRENRH